MRAMKHNGISPPLIALTVALIGIAALIVTDFRSGKPQSETMFSASTTASSVDAAGATVSPTRDTYN
jgi:hypothetical protein